MQGGDARQVAGQAGARAQDLHRIIDVQLGLLELLHRQAAALFQQFLRQAHLADVLQQAEVAEEFDLPGFELQIAAEGDHVDRDVDGV